MHKMASVDLKREKRIRAYVNFLTECEQEFENRKYRLSIVFRFVFGAHIAWIVTSFIVHTYYSSLSSPKINFAFHCFSNLLLGALLWLFHDDSACRRLDNQRNQLEYDYAVNKLKQHPKDIAAHDLKFSIGWCKAHLIDTVPSDQADRIARKFSKWENKLTK